MYNTTETFDKCEKYGISLNHKKSIFVVIEGKILGYIISKECIIVNFENLKVISQLLYPHNKRSMHNFFTKINFVMRFILIFPKIVRPL